jgi:hypothetical protein
VGVLRIAYRKHNRHPQPRQFRHQLGQDRLEARHRLRIGRAAFILFAERFHDQVDRAVVEV